MGNRITEQRFKVKKHFQALLGYRVSPKGSHAEGLACSLALLKGGGANERKLGNLTGVPDGDIPFLPLPLCSLPDCHEASSLSMSHVTSGV